ncbi:MAG: hypothetical protein NTV45_05375 [Firmicutes bacterium]|nr:hypothetical protein [Bacillota bacterium]
MRKKISLLTLVIISVLSLSLLISGCGKVAEKTTEKAIEKSVGGDAQVDLNKDQVTVKTSEGTMKMGGATEWPTKIPAVLPKFTYGKITSVMENTTAEGSMVIVGVDGVNAADIDKYISDLEKAGWKIAMTSKSDSGIFIGAEKDKYTVNISFGKKSDAEGYSGGISFVEEKPAANPQ